MDLALVTADCFQDALDWCDAVGQPDEGSFEGVQEPLVLRLRATLEEDEGVDGDLIQYVKFTPHPKGALVTDDTLQRFLDRAAAKTSTITGDILRSYGPACPTCRYRHYPDQECRAFLEPAVRLATYLVIFNEDPQDVAIVVGFEDEEDILEQAAEVGPSSRILGPVDRGVIFSIELNPDGSTESDPHYVHHSEWRSWLEPLERLLRNPQRFHEASAAGF
ncbi:MAG: hypothetical protein LC623_08825 [Halobacteriales archaeon]|nr:hypothetical protein [Halobacteriales archaeon]